MGGSVMGLPMAAASLSWLMYVRAPQRDAMRLAMAALWEWEMGPILPLPWRSRRIWERTGSPSSTGAHSSATLTRT
jgi:hypothetical protein